MKEELKSIEERAREELGSISDSKKLEDFRIRFLGKKGEITAILKQMGKLSAEERPAMGQLANKIRANIENALNTKKEELKSAAEAQRLKSETIDVTLPGKTSRVGRPHPLNATLDEIEEVFLGMGFDIVEGPQHVGDMGHGNDFRSGSHGSAEGFLTDGPFLIACHIL